jgi:hypothetical protein
VFAGYAYGVSGEGAATARVSSLGLVTTSSGGLFLGVRDPDPDVDVDEEGRYGGGAAGQLGGLSSMMTIW